jgi:uncharacterized protein YegJ (DUF2314 family)
MLILWLGGILLSAFLAVAFWLKRRRRSHDAPQGFVMLLRQPHDLDVNLLADRLSNACGKPVTGIGLKPGHEEEEKDDGPVGDMVTGESPHFIAHAAGTTFAIHNLDVPYMPDPIRASESFPELRLRKAIRDHTAWLSVAILQLQPQAPDAIKVAARVVSELIDSDCLALYHPPSGRFAPCFMEETIEKLRSDDPIGSVFRDSSALPVIPIDDDPRLKAAEAEARRRFEEFESAFRAGDGRGFTIKACISGGGNSEHIWIEVASILPNSVQGRLSNDPVSLGDLKRGSSVEVNRSEVEDWGFLRKRKPVGLFTVPVFEQIAKERERDATK